LIYRRIEFVFFINKTIGNPMASLATRGAISSIIGAAASTASAVDSITRAKSQEKELNRVKKENDKELADQQKKQKQISDHYAGMKTNLFSGEVGTGIDTSSLVQ
jgi:hypothetical protein